MAENADAAPDSAPAPATETAAPAVRSIISDGGEFDLAPARNAISSGAMTLDEATKIWALTPSEVKALGGKPPAEVPAAKKAPETELAEIKALRATDPKAYAAADKRHLELTSIISARATVIGDVVAQALEPLEGIKAELKAIDEKRRTDSRTYWRDPDMQARELKLLGEKEALEREGKTLEGLQAIALPVLETAADQAAFEGEFNGMYEAMPEVAQEAVRAVLAGDVYEPSKPATEAQVQAFAGSDIGGDLLQEWGNHAPRKLAMVRASVEQMISRGGDMGLALEWFDKLPPEQAKAIIRGLAR